MRSLLRRHKTLWLFLSSFRCGKFDANNISLRLSSNDMIEFAIVIVIGTCLFAFKTNRIDCKRENRYFIFALALIWFVFSARRANWVKFHFFFYFLLIWLDLLFLKDILCSCFFFHNFNELISAAWISIRVHFSIEFSAWRQWRREAKMMSTVVWICKKWRKKTASKYLEN